MGEFKMPIQHWITIVSQEVKVRIDSTCIYDWVFLINVDSIIVPPSPLPNPFCNPPPPSPPRPKNYSDLMDILLFLAFLLGMFISDGIFFAVISKVNFMNKSK